MTVSDKNPEPSHPIGTIDCGTCGWTDRSLVESGVFYPPSVRSAADRLRSYADVFPLVEVDSTDCTLPSEPNARLWAARTPRGFRFNIKAYGLLTHHPAEVRTLPEGVRSMLPEAAAGKPRVYLSGVPPEARDLLWAMHVEALRPLAEADKLGGVLFQFPPWFRATRGNANDSRELRERLPWPIAVECRGGGWMEDERRSRTFALLEELGLAYLTVDEPQGFRSSTPPVVACTARLAVVRFHGYRVETWEKPGINASERFRYLYSEDELRNWVEPIRDLARQADQVHVLLNNCYRDDVVRNARQLAELLVQA